MTELQSENQTITKNKMKHSGKKLITLIALVCAFIGTAVTAKADVTGVKAVVVSQQGQPIAVYYRQTDGQWAEIGVRADGTISLYRESTRDQFSIYLTDGSRNVQLDTHTNQVNYSDTGGQNIPNLYQIVKVIR